MPDRRVTLREASVLLGVSEGAIRKRVARGTIRSEMGEDGLRYVWVPEGTDGGDDGGTDASYTPEPGATRREDELVEELRDRVRFLEGQLAQANERDRENRRLLAGLIERVPELEAPRAQPEAPETVEEGQEGAEPRSATAGAQAGLRRSWWRRVFGGGGS